MANTIRIWNLSIITNTNIDRPENLDGGKKREFSLPKSGNRKTYSFNRKPVRSVNSSNPAKFAVTQDGEDGRTTKQMHSHISTLDRSNKSYVEALGSRRSPRIKLSYIPPEVVNGRTVVKYQSMDVLTGVNQWKSAAIGYVLGINPNFKVIDKFAHNKWTVHGFMRCFKVFPGTFVFQFENDKGRDEMIDSGPWTFAQYPIVLQPWTPESSLECRGVEKAPVWVKTPYLSLQFWNEEMFSKIGSYIGTPLFADSATSDGSRVSYARLYIEIEANKELPESVPLVNERGHEFRQRVEYEWLPPACTYCSVFGHEVQRCEFGGKKQVNDQKPAENQLEPSRRHVWRPKIPIVVQQTEVELEARGMESSRDEVVQETIVDKIVPQIMRPKGVEVIVQNAFEALEENENEEIAQVITIKKKTKPAYVSPSAINSNIKTKSLAQIIAKPNVRRKEIARSSGKDPPLSK